MQLLSGKYRRLNKLREDKSRPYKFLLIRNGLIGDNVFVTPVILKLKQEYPNSIVDIVCGMRGKDVFDNYPGLRLIHCLPDKFDVLRHIIFFAKLRKYKYDCVFVQEMNTHYTIMAGLTGAKLVLGYEHSLAWLNDFSVPRQGHAVPVEQALVNFVSGRNDFLQARLFTSPEEEVAAERIIREAGIIGSPVIALQSGCSEPDSVRQLSAEQIASLSDQITERFGASIVFLGTKQEVPQIESIRKLTKLNSYSLCGRTSIRELIAVLKKTDLVIGPDTGTLHIANALGKPVIMVMGYSDPDDTGPYDQTWQSVVIRAGIECIPCKYKNPKPANWEFCVRNRPALCMREINISDITDAAAKILEFSKVKK